MSFRDLSCFSLSYDEARAKFLAESERAQFAVTSYVHPDCLGPDQESLAIDVAIWGSATATKLLMVSSGIHGIEGFPGSAIQVAALRSGIFSSLKNDMRVLLVHAINPWGMAHYTRTNEDNIDLNRNFVSNFSRLPVGHPLTAMAHQAFVAFPPNLALRESFMREHPGELQAALTQGQHTNPYGLFYGGIAPAWSHIIWRKIVELHINAAQYVIHIDKHTGLGSYGGREIISASKPGRPAFKQAELIWGKKNITSPLAGNSSISLITGTIAETLPESFVSVAMEVGTRLPMEVLAALVQSNLSQSVGFKDAGLKETAKRAMISAFMPDDPAWKEAALNHGLETIQQAIHGFEIVSFAKLDSQPSTIGPSAPSPT